jgi:ABC-type glycerol-3-phosphate transport system substrate-binding protein
VGLLGLLGLLGGACAAPGQQAPQGMGAARPAVSVRVHARTGSEDEAFQQRLADFNQQNGLNITATYEGLGDYFNSLVTRIVAGTAGDTAYLLHTNLVYQQYANGGVLRAVDDLIARDRFDLSLWYPPAKPAMTFDGKLWGLPIRGQIVWNILFYNPNLVSGAGLADPETWSHADLTANVQRLTRKGAGDAVEQYGALPGGWGEFSYTVSLMRRFGGELISPDGKQVTVNSPACQAALQWYYDGWHRQRSLLTTLRPQGEGTYVPLGTGQAAMMISAQGGFRADINRALNGAYRLEIRVMPRGPGNRVGGFLALNSNAILRASTQPDAGWEVLKWLSNKDSSYALATQQTGSNTPNFRKDTYCDPRLLADPRFGPRSMEAICKGAELPEPDALIWNLRYDDFNRLLVSRMADIRDGKAEPTAGWLNALRVDLQAIADQPRSTGIGGR